MTRGQIQLAAFSIIGRITRAIDAVDRSHGSALHDPETELGRALGEFHDARAELEILHDAVANLNSENPCSPQPTSTPKLSPC